MTNNSQNNSSQDDQVLARLYKEGAKETPPAKLNYEIINQAANAEKSASVSSHFGGGWKVPLSLAASVVVVFGLLVQLDQSPQQLELPPIPEVSAPTGSKPGKSDKVKPSERYEANEAMSDETSLYRKDSKELDYDALGDAPIEERTAEESLHRKNQQEAQPSIIQNKPAAKKKVEQKKEVARERQGLEPSLEKSKSSNIDRLEEKLNTDVTTTSTLNTAKPAESPASPASQKPANGIDNRPDAQDEGMRQQRLLKNESPKTQESATTTSDLTSEIEAQSSGTMAEDAEQEFAPIPVEDWLLMIEKLIARKDYAEAARQLQKFKQVHPKVNVEDLEAKIP